MKKTLIYFLSFIVFVAILAINYNILRESSNNESIDNTLNSLTSKALADDGETYQTRFLYAEYVKYQAQFLYNCYASDGSVKGQYNFATWIVDKTTCYGTGSKYCVPDGHFIGYDYTTYPIWGDVSGCGNDSPYPIGYLESNQVSLGYSERILQYSRYYY